MTATLPLPATQALQVLTIAIGEPGINGVIAQVEARLQGRVGPRTLQPYYDLTKLFRKEALAPAGVGPFFLLAPIFSFACYLTVPMLIPALTSYPLPLGYMGDILGGGFVLALASFVVAVAAAETGSPYAQLASSRAKTFGAISEPVVLLRSAGFRAWRRSTSPSPTSTSTSMGTEVTIEGDDIDVNGVFTAIEKAGAACTASTKSLWGTGSSTEYRAFGERRAVSVGPRSWRSRCRIRPAPCRAGPRRTRAEPERVRPTGVRSPRAATGRCRRCDRHGTRHHVVVDGAAAAWVVSWATKVFS